MTNFKKLFYLLTSLTIVSCSLEQNVEVDVENLSGNSIKTDSTYSSNFPYFINNNLLVSYPISKQKGCGISKISNKGITDSKYLLDIGNGHNEFQGLILGKGVNGSLLAVGCPASHNKLLSVTSIPACKDADEMNDTKSWVRYSLSDIKDSYAITTRNVVAISDSTLLIPLQYYAENKSRSVFSILNYKSQSITPLDYWPSDGSDANDFVKTSMYVNGSFIYSNGNGRYLYICDEGYFAFIFTIDGNHVNVIKELYSEYPQYVNAEDGINYHIKDRLPKRLIGDVNSSNLYFLHRNKDLDGSVAKDFFTAKVGDTIDVFDWDGTLQRTLHLDKTGNTIVVSEDNDQLYLFDILSNEDGHVISSYSINEGK